MESCHTRDSALNGIQAASPYAHTFFISFIYLFYSRKALKVADLRQLLSKAAVSAPQKANKNELISRVLSTPSALELYSAQYDKKSLSPQQPQPEEYAWYHHLHLLYSHLNSDVDQLTDDPVEDPPTVPEPEKLVRSHSVLSSPLPSFL